MSFQKLPAEIRAYLEKRLELFSLTMSERASRLFAKALSKGIGLVMLAIASVLILISVSLAVGDLIGNYALGFLIVAVFILLIGFYLYKFKSNVFENLIYHRISKTIIKSMNEDELADDPAGDDHTKV